ncbi:MAG: thiamine phosphate synthase [Methyloceanibacter sp.]|uniref:thiamine phosphate synthase n=1 Tax=Methyloceanibacter sp. TaxID=1965321 RepID=UPI003D9B7E2F
MLRLDPFYPIVPDTAWLARLLGEGIKLVQLRLKNVDAGAVGAEIARAMQLCADHRCQLVVNDYWREAITAGADFVHLGQDDLRTADLGMIKAAGIRIGISTHSPKELETALAAAPDYVALGPIYPTKLKEMPWAPQGLDRLAEWRALVRCPLVAIGGITLERVPDALAAGADCAAVVTDIVTNQDPEQQTQNWLEATAPWRNLSTGKPPP